MDWSTLDPLDYYKQTLEPAHRQRVSATFEVLLKQSGVDAKANRNGVRKLQQIGGAIQALQGTVGRLSGLGTVMVIVAVVSGLCVAGDLVLRLTDAGELFSGTVLFWLSAAFAATLALWLFWLRPALRAAAERRAVLEAEYRAQKARLLKQTEPLNRLFTWDTVGDLLQASLPAFVPEPYVTADRLRELHTRYGWDGALTRAASVTAIQSGTIAGNPFFIVRAKEIRMVPKVYEGERTVHWTETERDRDGHSHTVRRSQTLYATAEHDAPEFPEFTFLLYAHEAAPALSFSRKPSRFSGGEGGFFRRWGKRRETKKLEAFSRNLTDAYGFTMMANKEFETLFHATDRTDEAAFRLLFTPLAQQQTVNLLHDTRIGYGDDFSFIKEKKINLIAADHLNGASLSSDPDRFRGYDLEAMRRTFFDGLTGDLRHLWFGLAPLMCVPLYRAPTPLPRMRDGDALPAGDWEHELQANRIGSAAFAADNCITDCILKSRTVSISGSVTEARIKAVGFSGRERTDTVSVRARNGRSYSVPVRWTEYTTVRRTTAVRFRAGVSAAAPRHVRASDPVGG